MDDTATTRRRTPRVTDAVRAAAMAALLDDGFAGVRMEDVARRAGVHKTTLYRGWGTREHLLADALATATGQQIAVPDTGDVRTDLVTLALRVRDAIVAPAARTVMAALAAGGDHPDLEEVGRRYWAARLAAARPIVERAVERRELLSDVDPDDLIIRVVGPIWFAVFGPQLPPDDAFVARTVDVALAGTRASGGAG